MISTAADPNHFAELLTGTPLPPAQLQDTLPSGIAVVGKDGGYHGYRTWSFHTADATLQLTASMTVGKCRPDHSPMPAADVG